MFEDALWDRSRKPSWPEDAGIHLDLFLWNSPCPKGQGVKTSSLHVNIQSWMMGASKPEGRVNEKRNKAKCWLYSQPYVLKGGMSLLWHCSRFQEENGYFFSQAQLSVTVRHAPAPLACKPSLKLGKQRGLKAEPAALVLGGEMQKPKLLKWR